MQYLVRIVSNILIKESGCGDEATHGIFYKEICFFRVQEVEKR